MASSKLFADIEWLRAQIREKRRIYQDQVKLVRDNQLHLMLTFEALDKTVRREQQIYYFNQYTIPQIISSTNVYTIVNSGYEQQTNIQTQLCTLLQTVDELVILKDRFATCLLLRTLARKGWIPWDVGRGILKHLQPRQYYLAYSRPQRVHFHQERNKEMETEKVTVSIILKKCQ